MPRKSRTALTLEPKNSTGQTPAAVNVTTTSGEVLAANADRDVATLVNDSDTVMYLAVGETAVVNRGLRLNARGGSLTVGPNGSIRSVEAVNAIHGGSGNKVITVQEFQWTV